MEKMIVFRCKNCIEDLKEYNPYVNKAGESIPLENIICIEVPRERCENTNFVLTPILIEVGKSDYRDVPFDEQVILLSKAIQNAIDMGYEINIKIWENYYEREEGLPTSYSMEEYLEDVEEDKDPAELLLYAVDSCYSKGGCVEIVASFEDHDCCLYHQEHGDEYLYYELFDFLAQRN